MKLKVPFYKQTDKNDCGPTALEMVLEYLGEHHSREKLSKLVDSESGGATWTLSLAKVSRELGFRTEFYTTYLGMNPENYELEFYKKETDGQDLAMNKLEKLKIDAHKLDVLMEEKSLSNEEILSRINKNCLAIVLLDWSKIKGSENFQGHFVPIVGYDEKKIYVHNQGHSETKEYFEIDLEIFEKARKSKGTDEDIVFIYRKLK